MGTAAGFMVVLPAERYELFTQRGYYEDRFAEPVPEFTHSRSAPLLCFIVSEDMRITHVARAKRGVRAGTDLRRLNMTNIEPIESPVSVTSVAACMPKQLQRSILARLPDGGLLSPKAFAAFVDALIGLVPSLKPTLSRFSQGRADRIQRLSALSRGALAFQKLAVSTAVTMAGLSRDPLQEWDPGQASKPASFLDGLPAARLREDAMVVNDLTKLPGYDLIKTLPYTAAVFASDKARLTVVLANRLPLEEQIGTDLIYFNETFRSFIMVQYKAMEPATGGHVFRLPDEHLSVEVDRMTTLRGELMKCPTSKGKDAFRLNDNPFYLKLCPRIVFDPDHTGLTPGMYIPLDYWSVLVADPAIEGPRGGKAVSYKNVGRYFDNTEFIAMVSKAWIGTTVNQATALEQLIRLTIETGKAAAIGIKIDLAPHVIEEIENHDPSDESALF